MQWISTITHYFFIKNACYLMNMNHPNNRCSRNCDGIFSTNYLRPRARSITLPAEISKHLVLTIILRLGTGNTNWANYEHGLHRLSNAIICEGKEHNQISKYMFRVAGVIECFDHWMYRNWSWRELHMWYNVGVQGQQIDWFSNRSWWNFYEHFRVHTTLIPLKGQELSH